MKRILSLLLMLISLGASAQWITDGESGYSVRTKLNTLHGIDSIDFVSGSLVGGIALDDTMNVVWVCRQESNDSISLPDASSCQGMPYEILKPLSDSLLTIYCLKSGDSLYFIHNETISKSYLFNEMHTGVMQVISNGDHWWIVMKLEDNNLTP